MVIFGINPVFEALRAGRVTLLRASDRGGTRVQDVVRTARRMGISVEHVAPGELDRLTRGQLHQGVVADVGARERLGLADVLARAQEVPLLVVLDGVEDPHNVGAILRTVDAAGADGVIRQTRRAAPLDGAAARASAGAVSHVRIADVVNIARALEELKAAGVWTVGLAGGVPATYDQIDLTVPTAIVVGAEGVGLRRLVRERCDFVVSIPMSGHVDSLNVSVATGIVLFEAIRQRRAAPGRR